MEDFIYDIIFWKFALVWCVGSIHHLFLEWERAALSWLELLPTSDPFDFLNGGTHMTCAIMPTIQTKWNAYSFLWFMACTTDSDAEIRLELSVVAQRSAMQTLPALFVIYTTFKVHASTAVLLTTQMTYQPAKRLLQLAKTKNIKWWC